jgi:hypothetical protein
MKYDSMTSIEFLLKSFDQYLEEIISYHISEVNKINVSQYSITYNCRTELGVLKLDLTSSVRPCSIFYSYLKVKYDKTVEKIKVLIFKLTIMFLLENLLKLCVIIYNGANTNGTNQTGFSALPGGRFITELGFRDRGFTSFFWSSTEPIPNSYFNWIIGWGIGAELRESRRDLNIKTSAYSVRCIKV